MHETPGRQVMNNLPLDKRSLSAGTANSHEGGMRRIMLWGQRSLSRVAFRALLNLELCPVVQAASTERCSPSTTMGFVAK